MAHFNDPRTTQVTWTLKNKDLLRARKFRVQCPSQNLGNFLEFTSTGGQGGVEGRPWIRERYLYLGLAQGKVLVQILGC
jgi:hypothetical protein